MGAGTSKKKEQNANDEKLQRQKKETAQVALPKTPPPANKQPVENRPSIKVTTKEVSPPQQEYFDAAALASAEIKTAAPPTSAVPAVPSEMKEPPPSAPTPLAKSVTSVDDDEEEWAEFFEVAF
jgi:hypothetical protein